MSLSLAGDGEIVGFDAVASGFGGLVAVKSALKTDIFSASVAAGAVTTVTGLTIDHAVSDAANKVLLFFSVNGGWAANTNNDFVARLHADATPIAIGDAAGSRNRITAGEMSMTGASHSNANMPLLYAPGSTSSIEYSVRVGHFAASTQTVYVNRSNTDTDAATTQRSVSSLILMEVRV